MGRRADLSSPPLVDLLRRQFPTGGSGGRKGERGSGCSQGRSAGRAWGGSKHPPLPQLPPGVAQWLHLGVPPPNLPPLASLVPSGAAPDCAPCRCSFCSGSVPAPSAAVPRAHTHTRQPRLLAWVSPRALHAGIPGKKKPLQRALSCFVSPQPLPPQPPSPARLLKGPPQRLPSSPLLQRYKGAAQLQSKRPQNTTAPGFVGGKSKVGRSLSSHPKPS